MLLGFVDEALAAEGHIHVCTADQLLRRASNCPEGEIGVCRTDLANSREFFDLFAERNELENVRPTFLLVCAVQRRHDDNFPGVRCGLRKLDDLLGG